MIETAENLRRRYSISREEVELAVRSHDGAIAGRDAGHFVEELIPVTVPGRRGNPAAWSTTTNALRADISVDKPAPDVTVTAGDASGQNDGVALYVVTTPEHAEGPGLIFETV